MDICVLFIIPMIEKGEFKHVGVLWSIIGKSMPPLQRYYAHIKMENDGNRNVIDF